MGGDSLYEALLAETKICVSRQPRLALIDYFQRVACVGGKWWLCAAGNIGWICEFRHHVEGLGMGSRYQWAYLKCFGRHMDGR